MNQNHLSTKYVFPYQNMQLYDNHYSNLCQFPQNYLQSYPFYSQNQLFSTYPSWPYGQLYQPYTPQINELTVTHSPEQVQTNPLPSLKPESEHQRKTNVAIEEEVSEQVDPKSNIEDQKKILRRLNRIKHITEVNKNRVQKKSKKNSTSYYWNSDENKRYMEFLKIHSGIFELSVSEKKNLRVNVMMSKKVKTRTPQQCHSHHQKMIKKYGSIENIFLRMENQGNQICEGQKIERDQVKDQVKFKDNIRDL